MMVSPPDHTWMIHIPVCAGTAWVFAKSFKRALTAILFPFIAGSIASFIICFFLFGMRFHMAEYLYEVIWELGVFSRADREVVKALSEELFMKWVLPLLAIALIVLPCRRDKGHDAADEDHPTSG